MTAIEYIVLTFTITCLGAMMGVTASILFLCWVMVELKLRINITSAEEEKSV